MARGDLRVYLGAAPGVGKTFAMLNEGRRRHDRGTDVVVGFVETHGRARTIEQLGDLEVVPRKHGRRTAAAEFEEMDVDAVLARRPAGRARRRARAHERARARATRSAGRTSRSCSTPGIDVISTVNIQHLESVNDVVERITGVQQRETLPDEVVRRADQVELVDSTPEALRRRMAHGNIYKPEKVDAALANYFRPGNLAALRELALLWVADKVDESLQRYMEDHGITAAWETRERVVVALTGAPGGEHLVRRASRIATRAKGDLLGVHVRAGEGLAGPPPGLARTAPRAAGRSRRHVPRDRRRRRVAGARRLRPRRARDAARHGFEPAVALGLAAAGLGHQPGRPRVGRHRRAHHLDPHRGASRSRARATSAALLARRVAPAPGARPRCSRSSALPLLTLVLTHERDQRLARQRPAALPPARRGRSPRSAARGWPAPRRWPRSCSSTGISRRRSTRGRSPTARTCSRWSCSSSSPRS